MALKISAILLSLPHSQTEQPDTHVGCLKDLKTPTGPGTRSELLLLLSFRTVNKGEITRQPGLR